MHPTLGKKSWQHCLKSVCPTSASATPRYYFCNRICPATATDVCTESSRLSSDNAARLGRPNKSHRVSNKSRRVNQKKAVSNSGDSHRHPAARKGTTKCPDLSRGESLTGGDHREITGAVCRSLTEHE